MNNPDLQFCLCVCVCSFALFFIQRKTDAQKKHEKKQKIVVMNS